MRFLSIVLIFLSLFLVSSCDLEMSNNESLDGYWQLVQIDTLDGGSQDMEKSRIYWSVQLNLLQFNKIGENVDYLMRFDYNDVNLRLYDPYLSARNSGDKPVTDIEELKPYGVNSLDENFLVETLNSGNLVLISSMLRLYFNRY